MNRNIKNTKGFTLIELLMVITIAGILTSIALPAYQDYIKKSKAKAAASELTSLSLAFENQYQIRLQYPTEAADTSVNSGFPTSGTKLWTPTASAKENFDFTIESTSSAYSITATGKSSLSGCTLTLNNSNERTSTSGCKFTTW